MHVRKSIVDLKAEQLALAEALGNDELVVFLDTNVLLWSFGLGEVACAEFVRWLTHLRSRLMIPQWVVHEYNHLSGLRKHGTMEPYSGLTRKVDLALEELTMAAAKALSDRSAQSLGFADRASLQARLKEVSRFANGVAREVSKRETVRQELTRFYENLIPERCLRGSVHALAAEAATQLPMRNANRLSPGGKDDGKPANNCGDLIIWKEILSYCASTNLKQAVLITNDVKPDWSYVPTQIILNGKEASTPAAVEMFVRQPNPDLLAEFEVHTRGAGFRITSIDAAVQALASTELNPIDSSKFHHLAYAVQVERSPTDAAVDWFCRQPQVYAQAIRDVCRWDWSPDEVDMEAFEAWCRQRMTDVKVDKVDWMQVFVALFL